MTSASPPANPTLVRRRSQDVTHGHARAGARAMRQVVGLDDDWDKPQVAVADSGNDVTPCNVHLGALTGAARDAIRAAGAIPFRFTTIAVSDAIGQGHEGMRASLVSREVIADSVELMALSHRLHRGSTSRRSSCSEGHRTVALVTDGRFSGATRGPCVGHVSPDAADGGPIALVLDGDRVLLDVADRRLDLLVSEDELDRRRAERTPPVQRYARGALAKYARLVGPASRGAVCG